MAEVLERKFNWSDEHSSTALEALHRVAALVEPRRHLDVIKPDHADNRILECALEASVDYLVTGDRRHLLPLKEYSGTRIVNAPQFLSALSQ
ncbi:MAG: PIN domain-containing protein [Caldilineaceae bacterium]|nr:PIN domain-containing protein [Caldilineaceae bacterium]